jgi:hypothetical protein
MKPLRCCALAVLLALSHAVGAARAQVPDIDEMAAAFRAAEPQARLVGLTLQPGVLWWAALRERSPLVAVYSRGTCLLGFVPFNPGRDYRWLFPALPPAQRASWLAGLVQHELAHCAEQAAAQADRRTAARTPGDAVPAGADARLTDALVAGAGGTRWHEVLADLAFALYVDQPLSEAGAQQVGLMASLRAEHARQDPAHDTSPELQCYLQQRVHFQPDGPWLQRLQGWRQRCWVGRTGG